jgi:hypothetical protein
MKSLRSIGAFVATAGVVVLLALPQLASAQATRTWVSGVGDDVNPCSRTAPCKTFAGAISKTATGGEIDCLDSGGFGSVTITKSIQIDCRDVIGGVLAPGVAGIIVNAAGAQVVLRHLNIDGVFAVGSLASGIRILSAASVHVEDVTIRAMGANGIELATSVPGNTRLTLVRVTSQDNLLHGMLVAPTGGATATVAVFDSALSGNTATGVRVNDGVYASLTNSLLTGNGTHGAAAVSSGGSAKMALDRITSSSNLNGGLLASGSGAVFYLSNVLTSGNVWGLYPPIGGGQYVSFGNNRTAGNTTGDGSPTSTISQF